MLIAKTNNQRDGVRKRTLDRPVRFGQVSLRFMMIGILAAVALLYMAQSTQSAARTYQLHSLEQQQKDLQDQNDRLQVESVRLQSLQSLQKDFSTQPPADGKPVAWEPSGKLTYVSGPGPVAERQP